MAVFWVVVPFRLVEFFTDVSDVLAASTIRAMSASETSINIYFLLDSGMIRMHLMRLYTEIGTDVVVRRYKFY
jgi:hypothetical protein